VQGSAKGKLNLRVLLADLRHYVRAALRRYMVTHDDDDLFELDPTV